MSHNTAGQNKKDIASRRWLISDFVDPVSPSPARRRGQVIHARGVHQVAARTKRLRLAPAPKNASTIQPQDVASSDAPTIQPQAPQISNTPLLTPVTPNKKRANSRPKRSFFSRRPVLLTLAAFIFVLGAGVSIWGWRANLQVEAQLEQLTNSADVDEAPPSTEKPTDEQIRAHVVAANMPRYLIIEKLGIKARVQTLGLTKKGAVQAPANVYDVGWYSGSSLPGVAGGASFMDGHVSSWSTAGIFKNLSKLAEGDIVKVELGSGEVLSYQVVKTEASSVETVDMQAALTPVTVGKAGLNLMTCHGDVRSGTSDFTERLTVFTQQI